MHVTLFVYGSWGDLRPYVVLGAGLQAAGHDVQIAAAPIYEDWVRARKLGFYPLSVDVNKLINDLSSRDMQNPIEQIRTARRELPPIFTQMGLDVLDATRGSDVLITIEFGVSVLMGVAHINKLKTIVVNPAPLNPTREFSSVLPPAPRWFPFPGWYNHSSYAMLRRIQWAVLGGPRKALEKKLPAAPKTTFKAFQQVMAGLPTLTIVSPQVVGRPADWAAHQQITGYLFDDDPDWQPPQTLTDFLAAGDAPVYIGFGSMPDSKPQVTTQAIIEALRQTGKRAVLLSGWAGLGATDVPENIHILDYASHHWLFPQMAAVVHHGGAGTTAAGLRAGVPTVIVPHNGDQPYWGRHLKQLGVGTDPIPRKKLNAETLSRAIQTATTDSAMRENARSLGEKIRQEDGLGAAVTWFARHLV